MKQESLVNKILDIFTKWNIGIFLFLFIGQCILIIFGFEFRSWIDSFRALQIILILPINLAIVIIIKMFDKEKNADDIKTERLANLITAVTIFVTVLFILVSSFAFLLIGDSKIESETFLEKDLIMGEKYDALGGLVSRIYSKPVLGILKKAYKDEEETVIMVMQSIYGREMEIVGKAEVFSGWKVYNLRDMKEGFTFRARHKERYGIEDDYYASQAYSLLLREFHSADRKVSLYYDETSGLGENPVMECISYEDAKAAAHDAMQAAEMLTKTPYFGRDGKAHCLLRIWNPTVTGQNKAGIALQIAKGQVYPTDEEEIRLALQQQFVQEDKGGYIQNTPREDNSPPVKADEIEGSTEWAYQKLYEEIFKQQGAEYNNNYNAKGNFYAYLYQKKGKLSKDSEEMLIEGTVVYNGLTKNEFCHEFVQYNTYYTDDADRKEYTTAIVEFYAVDKVTGKVYVADKHAWDQLPAKEYKNATEGDGS